MVRLEDVPDAAQLHQLQTLQFQDFMEQTALIAWKGVVIDFDNHGQRIHRAILRAREKCDDVLSLRRNQRKEGGMPVDTKQSEHWPKKVYEQTWSDGDSNRPTQAHWECPTGQHVYWWEVNIVDGSPYIPNCVADSEYWKQPKSSDE